MAKSKSGKKPKKAKTRVKELFPVVGDGYCKAPGSVQQKAVHKLAGFIPIMNPVLEMIKLVRGPDGVAFRSWVIE